MTILTVIITIFVIYFFDYFVSDEPVETPKNPDDEDPYSIIYG